MFFPNCKINGENIQLYLQRHYFNSIKYFWKAVTLALPEMLENGSLVGFELMNEPSCGLLGYQNIEEFLVTSNFVLELRQLFFKP